MMERESDPSAEPGTQIPSVRELRPTARPPVGHSPPAEQPETASVEPPAVIVPPPTPGNRHAAVIIPPPSSGSGRHDPHSASHFSLRKVVRSAPPGDPAGGHDVVPGGRTVWPTPQTASPNPQAAATETNARLEAIDASATDHQAAINNGLRWTMIGRPVIEGANLLAVAVLARLVAPAEFGRYTIALIVLLLAGVPAQAVQYPIVQRERIDRDHLKTGVTLTIIMGLVACVLCFAASYTVVPVVFGARTAVLVRLMIPALFINSVNTVQLAMITRRLEFRRLSLLDMVITLVGAAVSIPLAAIGLNGEAMVIGVLAGSTAGFLLVCLWVLPPLPGFRLSTARDLLRSGISAASNYASLVGFQNCDYVIVGARLGALQAGYYFRAYTLGVSYQTKVSQVVTKLGFPILARLGNEDEVQRLRQRMVHTMTLIVFPFLAALAIVAPKFVTWFYGPAWGAVVVPVQILTIGGAAMLIAQAITVSMLATGRARAVMLWGWGHFLVYGGAVFVVARLGLPAVALAAVIVHLTFLIISYVLLVHGSLRQAFKALATDALPAAASSLGLLVLALPASLFASTLAIPVLPYLLIVAVAGGAGYLLSLRIWFPNEARHLGLLAGRVLPVRVRHLVGHLSTATVRTLVRYRAKVLGGRPSSSDGATVATASHLTDPMTDPESLSMSASLRSPASSEAGLGRCAPDRKRSALTGDRRRLRLPWARRSGHHTTLGAVASRRPNNFDVLRLLGALLVLVSHAYALSGRHEPTLAGDTLGTVGVFIFFGISGFLVTKSWVRDPRLGSFFAKRALRILPALFVVSLLTAYVIGPLMTTASLGHYFGSPLTHAYVFRNATLRTDYLLPCVFANNPYPHAVNGSLWTLPTEARAYVAVACVGLLILFVGGYQRRHGWLKPRTRRMAVGSVIVLVLVGMLLNVGDSSHRLAAYGLAAPTAHELIGGISDQWYLFLTFGVGAALYVWRDRVALRWDALAAGAVVWVVGSHVTALPLSVRTALLPALIIPYGTLVVAFRGSRLLAKLTAWGDISYGVYIWAFPIEQIVALKFAHATPATLMAVSGPVTCLLAAASWLAVERQALRLKPGARTRPTPSIAEPGQIATPAPDNSAPGRAATGPIVGAQTEPAEPNGVQSLVAPVATSA